jgi:hypothetical protein
MSLELKLQMVQNSSITEENVTVTPNLLKEIEAKRAHHSLEARDMYIVLDTVIALTSKLDATKGGFEGLSRDEQTMLQDALMIKFKRAISGEDPLIVAKQEGALLQSKYGHLFVDTCSVMTALKSAGNCSHERWDYITDTIAQLCKAKMVEQAQEYTEIFLISSYNGRSVGSSEHAKSMQQTLKTDFLQEHKFFSIDEYSKKLSSKYKITLANLVNNHNLSCLGIMGSILLPHDHNGLQETFDASREKTTVKECAIIFDETSKVFFSYDDDDDDAWTIGYGVTLGQLSSDDTVAYRQKVLDNLKVIFPIFDKSGKDVLLDLIKYYTKAANLDQLIAMISETAGAEQAAEMLEDKYVIVVKGNGDKETTESSAAPVSKATEQEKLIALVAYKEDLMNNPAFDLDTKQKKHDALLTLKDEQGHNAVYKALEQGRAETAQKLLDIASELEREDYKDAIQDKQKFVIEHNDLAARLRITVDFSDESISGDNIIDIAYALEKKLEKKLEKQFNIDGDLENYAISSRYVEVVKSFIIKAQLIMFSVLDALIDNTQATLEHITDIFSAATQRIKGYVAEYKTLIADEDAIVRSLGYENKHKYDNNVTKAYNQLLSDTLTQKLASDEIDTEGFALSNAVAHEATAAARAIQLDLVATLENDVDAGDFTNIGDIFNYVEGICDQYVANIGNIIGNDTDLI